MSTHRNRISLPIVIIFGLISVSTASIFIRLAQEEAPSIVIAALRLLIATVLIAPITLKLYFKDIISLSRKDYLLVITSGFFLALHFSSWITSLEYTSIANSVVFVSTGPIWVALFAPLVLREYIKKSTLIGIIAAIIGGIIITYGDTFVISADFNFAQSPSHLSQRSLVGNFLALTGAISVSGYLIIGRILRARISLLPYIFLVYGSASIFLSLFMVFSGNSPFGYSTITYTWIFLLALVPQVIGHSIYNWALKILPATLVAVLTLGEPIGTTILAILILHEYPGILTFFGMFLILAGIFFVSIATKIE
ncbi:DMT family transporter [Chloroflexota bacterium]